MLEVPVKNSFDLSGRVAVITGGAGLLGGMHAEAIAEMDGSLVLLDLYGEKAEARAKEITATFGVQALGLPADITHNFHRLLCLTRSCAISNPQSSP